ncbi:MAG: hypothetical protein Q8S33_25385 [Myxococcales bacterium]|nr:hypothetical protein [Myxococcales bacterium]MDP3503694.1 hypothetical protein [Myxococcales bacterium]
MLTRLACASTLTALLAAAPAAAQGFSNDFQISKLGNPQPDGTGFDPRANGNFRVFARQLAAVMSSTNGMPPETLGHSGFAFSADFTYYAVDTSSLPTLGSFRGATWFPSVHLRKGLPFSFEVGARASWFPESRMGMGGLELKWALNEGFAYLPDIAVRGFVNKIINTRDFDLTSGGLDLGIGKQFAIAGMVTLTPYAGWSLVFVGSSTGNIDFRPSRSVAEADTELFKDYYVFTSLQAIQNTHNRFYGGLRFIGGHAVINAEVSYSVFPSFRDSGANENRTIPGVLAVTGSLGLDF